MGNGNKDGLADLKVLRRIDDLISILNMLDRRTMIASDFTESITRADHVSFTSLGEIVGKMNRCLNFWLIVGGLGLALQKAGAVRWHGVCAILRASMLLLLQSFPQSVACLALLMLG